MAEPRRVVVVGGGITGLAAAHAAVARASELGLAVAVTVLEKSARLGGNLPYTTAMDVNLGPDNRVYVATYGRMRSRAPESSETSPGSIHVSSKPASTLACSSTSMTRGASR